MPMHDPRIDAMTDTQLVNVFLWLANGASLVTFNDRRLMLQKLESIDAYAFSDLYLQRDRVTDHR